MLMIGDVGVIDDMIHIGDEAMFEAGRDELTARGAVVTGISSVPEETTARYGMGAVERIGFDGLDRDSAEARLEAVWETASGRSALAPDDPALAVIEAVAASDGVLVAGGGNLASTWPLHVYERAALGGVAARTGTPLVVSGQTLGPALTGRDRDLVAGLLRGATLAGVRESASHRLAADLGVEARLGVDDASFVGMTGESAAAEASVPTAERGGVLVSLSLSLGGAPRDETVARIAHLVDEAVDAIGAPARFHAHFGPLTGDVPRGDAVLHEEVRMRMRTASEVVPSGDSCSSARLARSSALLITGRYHPAVFAAPGGVPVIGLVTDAYTSTKQRGALAHWGQDGVVPITSADSGGVAQLRSLVRRRVEIDAEAARRLPAHRADAADWWDRIATAFS